MSETAIRNEDTQVFPVRGVPINDITSFLSDIMSSLEDIRDREHPRKLRGEVTKEMLPMVSAIMNADTPLILKDGGEAPHAFDALRNEKGVKS